MNGTVLLLSSLLLIILLDAMLTYGTLYFFKTINQEVRELNPILKHYINQPTTYFAIRTLLTTLALLFLSLLPEKQQTFFLILYDTAYLVILISMLILLIWNSYSSLIIAKIFKQ